MSEHANLRERFYASARTSQVVCFGHRVTRAGDFKLEGYWPETNDSPLFAVRGGWVDLEDMEWLRDELNRLLGPVHQPPTEGR